MFGCTNLKNLEEARYSYCQAKCKPETYSEPSEALKHVDPSMFPPCRSVLVQQIKRSWLVAKLYKNATSPEPLSNCTPLDYGYELIETCLQVEWHDAEQVPQEVDEESENVDHDVVAEYGEEIN